MGWVGELGGIDVIEVGLRPGHDIRYRVHEKLE